MNDDPLITYTVIKLAMAEDEISVLYVVHHYARYIARLAMRSSKSLSGTAYHSVDEGTARELETKLIAGILKFRIPKR